MPLLGGKASEDHNIKLLMVYHSENPWAILRRVCLLYGSLIRSLDYGMLV
jgi:hypothetical protein